MVKPRIFISHSTSGTPEDYALKRSNGDPVRRTELEVQERSDKRICDDLSRALTQSGRYAVLLDHTGIQPGEGWYSKLNVWLSGCDAAIILLSERAIQSSHVTYEASVLCHRQRTAAKAMQPFVVLPVYLGPVDPKAINATGLGGSHITELQAIRADSSDSAGLCAAVQALLCNIQRGDTPLERQIDIVTHLLKDVPPATIIDLADRSGLEQDDWDFRDLSPERRLAANLMAAGLDAAVDVLEILRGWLSETHASSLREIINRVRSSWVPPPNVTDLMHAAANRKSVAAALSSPLAAQMFLWCAHPTYHTGEGLTVAQVAAVSGASGQEGYLSTLEDQISRALVVPLRAQTPADALRKLAARAKRAKTPVFVISPHEAVEGSALAHLTTMEPFKYLVLFVLAGATRLSPKFLESGGVTLLEPPLEPGYEDHYCAIYEETCDLLLAPRIVTAPQ